MLPNLKVENISSVRSEKAIFENINFEVLPGQNIEIIGSNGSGKTTLLRTILGLIKQESGEISWLDDNENYNPYRVFDCLYQGHQLGVKNLLTVYENLQLTKNAKGMTKKEIYNTLSRVGLSNINCLASNLSVGQRKRIAIARWLLRELKIYLIDEPFSALDDEATLLIENLIRELNSKGCSFIVTGHRPSGIIATRVQI
ncbi:MAG: heme ABC exporter ATP-binding protein CcmA [SAR86 cluster bacterium]|nr:heme ABC exporter ATP-binding protein CcmA [SAR86 cluster bacterium]